MLWMYFFVWMQWMNKSSDPCNFAAKIIRKKNAVVPKGALVYFTIGLGVFY